MAIIKNEFYIKDIFNSEDALAYYGSDSFYTTILNNESYSPFFATKDLAYNYYQPLKDLFDSNFDDNFYGNNSQLFVFFNSNDSDNLYYIIHGESVLYGTRYSSGEKRISFNSSNYYKFNINDKTSTSVSGWGGNLDNLTNSWYCLFSSVQIKYEVIGVGNRHDFNYLLSQDMQGKGQGGWQVPDPNPKAKILLNGSEPTDIKFNGSTPDKIILNGVTYWENPPKHEYLYKWDFTKSSNPLIDKINNVEITNYSSNGISIDNGGLHNNHIAGFVEIPITLEVGNTYEMVIGEMDCKVTGTNGKFFTHKVNGVNKWDFFGYRKDNGVYTWKWNINSTFYDFGISINDFSNSTLKIIIGSQLTKIYLNDVLIGSSNTIPFSSYTYEKIRLFGDGGSQGYFDATIKEFNVYVNEE